MSKALDIYNQSIKSSHSLSEIYAYMRQHVVPYDIMELLRAEYVMIVSAFDTYFHSCVLLQMVAMVKGTKEKSNQFNNFGIPLSAICAILEDDNPINRIGILQNAIRNINSKDSYQGPQAIEHAASLMGLRNVWRYLGEEMEMTCDDIKMGLSLIIRRRNQIAHESDMNYETNTKRDIKPEDLDSARNFLTRIVRAIDKQL